MALSAIGSFILTLVLAGSTVLLWRETKRLAGGAEDQHSTLKASVTATQTAAEAAALQAKALVAVELPMVFLTDLRLLERARMDTRHGQFASRTYTELVVARVPESTFKPKFEFTNHGRTPAEVLHVLWSYHIGLELPEGLPWDNYEWGPPGTLIPAQGGVFTHDETATVKLTDAQREAMDTDREALWLFGAIHYRDFMGKLHAHGFSGLWWWPDPGITADTPGGFRVGGPESYQYSD